MKEIIKRNNLKIELLTLEENTSLLEYLKKESSKFVLRTISTRNFEELKNQELPINVLDCCTWDFIADYGQASGNQELVRLGQENFMGYYTIDNESIIYHPKKPEIYTYTYSGIEYFTKLDMSQLLFEILSENKNRNLLLDLENKKGETKIYERINESQMMEYALNPEKGKKLIKTIRK